MPASPSLAKVLGCTNERGSSPQKAHSATAKTDRRQHRMLCARLHHGRLGIGAKGSAEAVVVRSDRLALAVLFLPLLMLLGCQELIPRDTSSLIIPRFRRSEIFGFVAGFGTTFAAVPDLAAMLKRPSSAGMNPRMAAMMGCFSGPLGVLRVC